MTSDAELVREVCAGQTEAYTELVRRWAARITALCHARLGRAHVADFPSQIGGLRVTSSNPAFASTMLQSAEVAAVDVDAWSQIIPRDDSGGAAPQGGPLNRLYPLFNVV